MTGEELREKDLEVLRQIADGNNDVQRITSATTLKNHEVNYCFTKLQNLDLIQVEKPSGRVTREINGQKRNFQAPKQAELTDKGRQHLKLSVQVDLNEYENLSHSELVEKIHELERRFEDLERKFEVFRIQVLDKKI